MKKTIAIFWCAAIVLLLTCQAGADLVTIGTAGFDEDGTNGIEADEYFKLIWDNDNDLVWLDYSNGNADWDGQSAWAGGLDLDIRLAGYTVTWLDTAWRLPSSVDGPDVYGYGGDPDGDGIYTYTWGYNLANSEMGHLFYTELGNLAYLDIHGNAGQPGSGLTNTGDFDYLMATWYWSGTPLADEADQAWVFFTRYGYEYPSYQSFETHAMAVRSGLVRPAAVPVPGAILLLGSGLLGAALLRKRSRD